MKFEHDENKSQINKEKHGIDFIEAQNLWKEIMKKITAEEFDTKFDNGEDIDEYLDFSKTIKLKDINKLKTETKKVNVDFPEWVIESLDKEAKKIAVIRQSIIKVRIAERLKEEARHQYASYKT